MSRTFVIPDIHLKPKMLELADNLIDNSSYDNIVFLGDVVDDWYQQNNLELYRDTFREITGFIKKYDNVYFCYGNHDISYEWEALESGYSYSARDVVMEGLNSIRNGILPDRIGFVHRIDSAIFSHAGITEKFVRNWLEIDTFSEEYEIDHSIKIINLMRKKELWRDESPIWARPPYESAFSIESNYIQVSGHTPVMYPELYGNILILDTFSTNSWGDPIGDERFVWIDTKTCKWGYADA